jgi:hypothetical protein
MFSNHVQPSPIAFSEVQGTGALTDSLFTDGDLFYARVSIGQLGYGIINLSVDAVFFRD